MEEIKKMLVDGYKAIAFTDKYIYGFIDKKVVYVSFSDDSTLDFLSTLDKGLAQFPEDVIDNIALDMANEGLIETNFYDVNGMWGFAGFRRIRKTWKEKIMCRLSK